MLLQLNPPIPLWHPASAQSVSAILVIDYSEEHDLLFVVIRRDGEIWTHRAAELRGVENITMGRPRQPHAAPRQTWNNLRSGAAAMRMETANVTATPKTEPEKPPAPADWTSERDDIRHLVAEWFASNSAKGAASVVRKIGKILGVKDTRPR